MTKNIDMQEKFIPEQWALIEDILKNGKTMSWQEYAEKYLSLPRHSKKNYSTKKAHGVWRRYNRLQVAKPPVAERKVISCPTEFCSEDVQGKKVVKVTTGPNGIVWKTFAEQAEENIDTKLAIQEMLADLPSSEELFLPLLPDNANPSLAVVNLYDAHLDKLPVKSTCGYETTLELNIQVFEDTVSRISKYLQDKKNITDIILPVGNDLFHTNGFNNRTKKGTEIEMLCEPHESYKAICTSITKVISTFSKFANVEVIMIKGNHDEDKITTLGYWLEEYFKIAASNVTVSNLRRQRKYITFGKNLIGFAHGDKEKSKIPQLPLIMAQENPQAWGNSKYRKMYLGDLHHGFEYQFLKAKDMPGVEVEYLRSVGTTDTWHEDHGWIGIPKTAYVQLFDYYTGEDVRKKFNIEANG